jgi:hypothetical protein
VPDVATHFGFVATGVGDVTGDGVPDIALGDPGYLGSAPPGQVVLKSGADGSTIRVLLGESFSDRFGSAVARAGDVDGDGLADFVVGAPKFDGFGTDVGRGVLVSGATGAALHVWNGDASGDEFGSSIAGGGDVDGDGVEDVVAAAPSHDLPAANAGQVKSRS